MSVWDEIKSDVATIYNNESWDIIDGRTIPDLESVALGQKGKRISATILYADLVQSTALVDGQEELFAAQIYKAYLRCAVKLIRHNKGVIASFDGDRVMAIFHGGTKEDNAVRAAFEIHGAVSAIINPILRSAYPKKSFTVRAVCGVDTSPVLAIKAGIRDNNDLVWVGRAANHAAKLCNERGNSLYTTFITPDVYKLLSSNLKKTDSNADVWEAHAVFKPSIAGWKSSCTIKPPAEETKTNTFSASLANILKTFSNQ